VTFLETTPKWKKLLQHLEQQEVVGIDSEFEGVDFSNGDSCVGKARVDVWSIAWFDDGYNARGYNTADGVVLPAEALPYFKDYLENPKYKKVAHNSSVDVHAMYNSGVDLQGVVNTLTLARWVLPGRISYSLENLCTDYLGVGKSDSFEDIFSYTIYEDVVKSRKVRMCSCGEVGCRKRKGHDKIDSVEEYSKPKKAGTGYVPLSAVRPGHSLWERYLEYARVDAIRALELYDYLSTVDWQTEVLWYKS
jgi:DNA polymerase I-like protein with 3'-5' exonuclease and polymerase domains